MNNVNSFLIVVVRLLLGAVFIYASMDKIQDAGQFARSIGNYHVLPFGLENLVAIVLPWLELFIGIGLIIGVMVDGAALICSGLFAVFIIMIFQAILRGYNIECGCGLKEGEMVGWSKILENIVMLGATWLVMVRKEYLFEFFPKSPLSD